MPYILKQQLDKASRDAQREMLFKAFESIGMNIQRLNSIIQNDVPISQDNLKEWLDVTVHARNELDAVIEATTAFILTKGVV